MMDKLSNLLLTSWNLHRNRFAMRLVTKLLICVSLITLPVLVESCCDSPACDCGSGGAKNYTITKLSLSTQTRGTANDTISPSPAPLRKYRFVIDIEGKQSTSQLE